jgi:hypothetical protein
MFKNLPPRRSLHFGLLKRLLIVSALSGPLTVVSAGVASAAQTVTVPVVVCYTTNGGVSLTPAPVPASAQVPAADRNLEVYSLVAGSFQVLAPRDMGCQGSLGVDGTTDISVGAGEPVSLDVAPTEGVTATVIPAS